jgi:PAS domain S-box-containing protein
MAERVTSDEAGQPAALDSTLVARLLEVSPDGLVLVDSSGRITYANRAVEELYGAPPSALLGQPVEVLVPDAALAREAAADEGVSTMVHGTEFRARRADGTEVAVEVSTSVVERDDGGPVTGFLLRDATTHWQTVARLQAFSELAAALLEGQPIDDILTLTARRVRQLVRAAGAWVAAAPPGSDGPGERFVIRAADGEVASSLIGFELPEHSLSSEAAARGTAFAVDDVSSDPRVPPEVRRLGYGNSLFAPLTGGDRVYGTLIAARWRTDEPFSPLDLNVVRVFAGAAALAIAQGENRTELDRLRAVEDHERIARELHDSVIQRLFSVGLLLQGSLRLAATGELRDRLTKAVDELDGIITSIRSTVFGLSAEGQDR